MTRDERLAAQEANAQDALRIKKIRLARVQALRRAETDKALTKRQLLIGKLAHDAGLLAWDNVTLAGLFALLTPLTALAHPDLVLGRVLARVPLDRLVQETAEVQAEVDALIADHVTLVLVDDAGQPLGRNGYAERGSCQSVPS